MTNGLGSTLLVLALRFPALPDPAAPGMITTSPWILQQSSQASLMSRRRRLGYVRRPGDSSRTLRRERSSTLAVGWSSTNGTRLSERGRRLERTVRRSRVRRTMPSWLLRRTLPFEQRDRPFSQTVREEFDGYRAHLATEMQEDIPAHVEARIADVFDFSRGSPTRVPAGWNSMPAGTVKCLQRHCARRRIAS